MVSYGRPSAPGPEASAPARTARRVAARADGKPARQLAHRHRSTRGAATRPAAAASAAGAGRPPRRTAGTAVTAARYVAPALSATAARRAGPDGDASAVRARYRSVRRTGNPGTRRAPRHPLPRGYSRIGSTICAACRTAVGCWSCSASKSRTELLVDALIGAACRLRLDDELERALCAGACRTSAKIGKSAGAGDTGRLRRPLGFQRRDAATRPESRVNPGQPIFTPPPQPAVDWSRQQRLTRLAPTPTKNTAFYIYDWLIGLQTLLAENAATESALGEQRAALEGSWQPCAKRRLWQQSSRGENGINRALPIMLMSNAAILGENHAPFSLKTIDHVVLRVRDMQKSLHFIPRSSAVISPNGGRIWG